MQKEWYLADICKVTGIGMCKKFRWDLIGFLKSLIVKLLAATSLVTMTGGCHQFDISNYDRVAIDLSKAGSVSTTLIKINRDDNYKFSLAFNFDREGKKYLQDIPVYMELIKYLGDYRKSPPGAIIPVKLTINKLNTESQYPYHNRIYDTGGLYGSTDNAVFRQITIVHLEPGRYAVRLENLQDFPDLPKSTVTLEVLRFFAK